MRKKRIDAAASLTVRRGSSRSVSASNEGFFVPSFFFKTLKNNSFSLGFITLQRKSCWKRNCAHVNAHWVWNCLFVCCMSKMSKQGCGHITKSPGVHTQNQMKSSSADGSNTDSFAAPVEPKCTLTCTWVRPEVRTGLLKDSRQQKQAWHSGTIIIITAAKSKPIC